MSNVLTKIAMLLLVCAFPMGAVAHDPKTHLADAWSGAYSKSGTLCCNGSDYDIVHNWRRTAGGFEVMLSKGVWTKVPPEAVVTNIKNSSLEAKIWLSVAEGDVWIRCFAPGVEV